MKIFEIAGSTPVKQKVGREFNHLEDLVFTEENGAQRAIMILKSLAKPASKIAIKWDGNPTIYWGRDPDGTFRMVGKNNWGRPEGKSSSPRELKQFIMSRGKGEDWREQFANDMAAMWPIFEKATPKDFRGYVFGDILFNPAKPFQVVNGNLTFTPNKTTYIVKAGSKDFQKLSRATIAVAAHQVYPNFGDKVGTPFTDPNLFSATSGLAVYGQTYVNHRPAVGAENIKRIEALAAGQDAINQMLTPVPGMGYLRTEIYAFVNSQAKAKQLQKINTKFFLAFEQKTPAKIAKITAHLSAYPGVLDQMFELVREIMKAKDEIIAELDQAGGDITATTGEVPGGEGYVSGKHFVKLVPRHRWTPN